VRDRGRRRRAFPVKSIYVIPENTPHSFQSGHEPLVLMSFHTVPVNDLVEIEIEGGRRRRYGEAKR
jgi:gentisate 1,2-dioxygenase